MAGRGRESLQKRERERTRDEKAKVKAARKQERQEAETPTDETEEQQLLEQFRRLSERHDAGDVTDGDFAEQRQEIFEALGIDAE